MTLIDESGGGGYKIHALEKGALCGRSCIESLVRCTKLYPGMGTAAQIISTVMAAVPAVVRENTCGI